MWEGSGLRSGAGPQMKQRALQCHVDKKTEEQSVSLLEKEVSLSFAGSFWMSERLGAVLREESFMIFRASICLVLLVKGGR